MPYKPLYYDFFIQPYNVNICGFQLLYISGNDDISKKVFFCVIMKRIFGADKNTFISFFFYLEIM